MIDHPRARKIADRIKVIVAETIEHRVKDPRLGFVTVTDARVTGDLQHATVFYTVFGSEEERVGTAAALESAKGVIRREVGQGIGIRLTPTLEFIADDECVELTPAAIRLRKVVLDSKDRERIRARSKRGQV